MSGMAEESKGMMVTHLASFFLSEWVWNAAMISCSRRFFTSYNDKVHMCWKRVRLHMNTTTWKILVIDKRVVPLGRHLENGGVHACEAAC
jgi:hypothetical protein